MSTRKILVGVAGLATVASLAGLGAGASFLANGSATESFSSGSFGITVSAPAPAVVVNSGTTHTVTLVTDPILSSVAGSLPLNVSVGTVGTIPVNIHVVATDALPTSKFSDLLAPQADVVLHNGDAAKVYNGGVSWTVLDNTDLSKSGTVTYTFTASEVTALPALGTMTTVGGITTIRIGSFTVPASDYNNAGETYTLTSGDTLSVGTNNYGSWSTGPTLATSVGGVLYYSGPATGHFMIHMTSPNYIRWLITL